MSVAASAIGHSRDPRLNPRMAAKVAGVRAKWEDAPRRSVLLSFDEMLDALLDLCMSYEHIASACGVSRERIRQIHRDFFSPILPYQAGTGHRRQRVCSIVRRKAQRESLAPMGAAAVFAEAAGRNDLLVTAVVLQYEGGGIRSSTRDCRVNGQVVTVRITRMSYLYPRSYTRRFHIGLSERRSDFLAIWCDSPLNSWFIFPWSVLSDRKWLYIPEHPCEYVPAMGITDWLWQYREAWRLLKEQRP